MLLRKETYILVAIIFICILNSCNRNFQFSVLEVKPLDRNINQKAIVRLKQIAPRDSFSFLVISDTQVAYNELEEFVSHANKNYTEDSIVFILHGGDFTDYGANFEYNLYYDDAKDLKFPVIGAIGNHDMLSNGREIFRKLFGQENFSFTYGDNKFIVFNTNGREVGFNSLLPDLTWLKQEVENTSENNIFYLAHVSPMSHDFDPTLRAEYVETLASNKKTRLSIHGHTHSYEYDTPYNDGVPYVVAPTLQKRQYVKVSVMGKNIKIQQRFY